MRNVCELSAAFRRWGHQGLRVHDNTRQHQRGLGEVGRILWETRRDNPKFLNSLLQYIRLKSLLTFRFIHAIPMYE